MSNVQIQWKKKYPYLRNHEEKIQLGISNHQKDDNVITTRALSFVASGKTAVDKSKFILNSDKMQPERPVN